MPKLVNADTRQTLLTDLEIAQSFWKRFVGMMFRNKVSDGFGIWIKPCKSIHTMWMRIPIDVYFIGNNNTVIGIKKGIKPWRIAIAPENTHSVLETPAGRLAIPILTRIEAK